MNKVRKFLCNVDNFGKNVVVKAKGETIEGELDTVEWEGDSSSGEVEVGIWTSEGGIIIIVDDIEEISLA